MEVKVQSRSQLGQDIHVLNLFNKKRNGYFLDIGAFDGVSYSNTYLLEKEYGWKGICVEPLPDQYEKLISVRTAYCCDKALYKTSGEKLEFISADMLSGIKKDIDCHTHIINDDANVIEVETISPSDLLKAVDAPFVIDYMSLDTEGSELSILEAFDFDTYIVKFINVEHNHQEPRRTDMRNLLESKGYIYIGSNWCDDNYIHHSFLTGTYFEKNKYMKPVSICFENNNSLTIESPFAPKHNMEIVFDSDTTVSIYSEYFGRSDIVENALSFRESGFNIEKDSREAIVFVGANNMEEILKYVNIYNRGIFIEAIPHIAKQLERTLTGINAFYNTNYKVCNKLITSENDKQYNFNVFNNNGASSSIYDANENEWKWNKINKHYSISLSTIKLDTLLENECWKETKFDLLLDVQGAELEVLKGIGNYISNVSVIYTEISCKEFYKGGVLFDDLNKHLEMHNFKLHECFQNALPDHGDVVYVRNDA